MALGLTPGALSFSNQPHRHGIWVPAFAGMSGYKKKRLVPMGPAILL
jgi:hypothetical protein